MKEIKKLRDDSELYQIASDLVKIPSYSFLENCEKEVAAYIAGIFDKEGIETQIVEVLPGRPNVYGVLRGQGNGKSLNLSGHMDTVPAYSMENPFGGAMVDGILYGRGSCDMKGPLAAMIYTLIELKREGIKLQGDLYFTGVIDEEEQGKGIEAIIKNGPYTDGAIVGEPTDFRIAAGNRGLEWMEIVVSGQTVHGGAQDKGVNAILKAAKVISRLESDYIPALSVKKHALLGAPTFNIGTISGGDQLSTVPGKCTIKVDRRWIPEETRDEVYAGIRAVLAELEREDPQFRAELRDVFEGQDLLEHKPFFTEENDPLIRSAKAAFQSYDEATGTTLDKEITICPAWTDAGFLANFTNTKCIILGPGELPLAHSKEEHIKLADLGKAVEIYKRIAVEYCGVAGE